MEEEEFFIIRNDTAQGLESTIMRIEVNKSVRMIKDGKTIILYETLPAKCRAVVNGVTIWEREIRNGADSKYEINVGLTPKIADALGLSKAYQPEAKPAETKQAARIKRLLDESKKQQSYRDSRVVVGLGLIAFSLVFALIVSFSAEPKLAFVFLSIAAFSAVLVWINKSWKPYSCNECGAPTIERIASDEKYLGTRSEQRHIWNSLTKEQEQRTVTVSDSKITEKWECATCLHCWNYSYETTRD